MLLGDFMAASSRADGAQNGANTAPAPTIRDVAAAAGVSLGTVSNYLNRPNSVAIATRARIRAAIDSLGFVRNAGAAIIRSNSDEDPEKEQRYLEVLEEQRVLGVLISAVDGEATKVDWLRQRGTSVVLIESARPNFCSVRTDDIGDGELAADHLISLGHRTLVYATAALSVRQYQERLTGIRRAMKRHGLPETALTIVEEGIKGSTADGRLAAERILKQKIPGT